MSYIDREKVKEFIKQYFYAVIDRGEHEVNAVDCGVELLRVISDMPAADVVKVPCRCKDCGKSEKTSEIWKGKDKYFCDRHKSFVLGDDFCSYAEKK